MSEKENLPAVIEGKAELVAETAPLLPQDRTKIERQWAQSINASYRAMAEVLVAKVVTFGFLLNHVKEQGKRTKVIPHGQFLPWLEKHCPSVSIRTAQVYMQLADKVSEHLQIRSSCAFDGARLSKILSSKPAKLTADEAELRAQFFALVDGKSQRQLLLELGNLEPPKKEYHPPKPVNADEEIAAEDENDTQYVKAVTGDLLNLTQALTLCHVSHQLRFELQAAARAVAAVVDEINGDPEAYAAKQAGSAKAKKLN